MVKVWTPAPNAGTVCVTMQSADLPDHIDYQQKAAYRQIHFISLRQNPNSTVGQFVFHGGQRCAALLRMFWVYVSAVSQ